MKKYIMSVLFLSVFPLCAQAEHICVQWISRTLSDGRQRTHCEQWKDIPASSAKTAPADGEDCDWETVKDRFGNEISRCIPQKRSYICKIWKTAILKNGSRRSYCWKWLYNQNPSDSRIICREFVSEPLSEKLVRKQKQAWISECSKFDAEKNGKFCLLWKHEYQPDGTVISRCTQYQQENEAGLFVSEWTDYIGEQSDLKPVASIAEHFATNESYPCSEYTGSKMDKKEGKYSVTCTRFATKETLPRLMNSKNKSTPSMD